MADGILERVGLQAGEPVRFRRVGAGRWTAGRIAALHPDGSISVHDPARRSVSSMRPGCIEVRRPGSRGRLTWQNVETVAITWEQLVLW